MRVLVTGANGFVGTELTKALVAGGHHVYGVVRNEEKAQSLVDDVQPVVLPSFDDLGPLAPLVDEVDCVVHLAARVHQMKETSSDPLAAFRHVNVEATTNLARWASRHLVRRFVFLSSVKVQGEGQNSSDAAYSERDTPSPRDPYGLSKWEAEKALRQIGQESGLETVALRPTLIFGPKVKANFLQLLRMVNAGLPMPLGRIENARSLLYLGNLVSAIQTCMHHDKAAGETFLVSDGEDLSTPELIRRMAEALERPARLIPVPPAWIVGLGKLTGKSAAVHRILGSLRVDSRKIRETLHWSPPFTVDQGLQVTAKWFQSQQQLSKQGARAA